MTLVSQRTSEFDYAPGWKPELGDVAKGAVAEITEYAGGGYGSYPIVAGLCQVKDDREVAVHAYHTSLRNQLAELNIQPGDEIGILYKGKAQKRDGSGSYEDYRVKRLNQTVTKFDWSGEKAAAIEDPTPEPAEYGTQLHRPLEKEDDQPLNREEDRPL